MELPSIKEERDLAQCMMTLSVRIVRFIEADKGGGDSGASGGLAAVEEGTEGG